MVEKKIFNFLANNHKLIKLLFGDQPFLRNHPLIEKYSSNIND